MAPADAGHEQLADEAAPLDVLLADAAAGPLRRFAPDASTAKFAVALARRPVTTARRLGSLAAELARIGVGTSVLAPPKRDRRFADPAWTGNLLLRRVVQAYLASAKAAIDTGGFNLVHGGISLARDMASKPRIPEMVDTSSFEVGRNIAATPGAVVLRTEILELIQYRPQTTQVREVPLLIVPPTINKYYAMDLAPGRSLVEYLVQNGQQAFVISWRNPDARDAEWGMDTYVGAVLDALDAVQRVCGVDQTALTGVCAGGIIASITAGHLAATGRLGQLAAFGLFVTVLDTTHAGTLGALADRRLLTAAKAISRRRGYLDGRDLAEMFAWLRPGDLIWNYWVNNYLQGQKPPAFDVLFWNADTTRMAAGLHADFVDLAMDNKLLTPGSLTILGTAIDLSQVDTDAYLVAGIADHITPWQNCYRSTQLLGGTSRFILSTSGHIAALVNPPGNPKARYQISKTTPADPEAWLKTAATEHGTWWPDMLAWLGARCGKDKPAPGELGGGGLRPLADAPGTYVFDT